MRKGKPELLAPAGSYEGVIAAAAAGADAVYVGGSRFGARAFARNLSEEELLDAIDYLHLRGKQLHLTVNTLLKDREMEELYDYIAPLYARGLDAVIVQDLGVLSFLSRQFPDLALHASTQMTVTGVSGVKLLEQYGVDRAVLARELSLEEIASICRSTDMEIECFIHGALCYCYSGQCLMSSLLGGRSGNRGRCAQPCRLSYEVPGYTSSLKTKNGKGNPPVYPLSPRDICTLPYLPELLHAGVTSLKIEGRMKRSEYTAGVVSIYRKYLDMYEEKGSEGYQVSAADMETLERLYTRSGFSGGYLKQHNGPQMMALNKPDYDTSEEAFYAQFRKKYIETKNQEKVNGNLKLFKGNPATLEVRYGKECVFTSGAVVQQAQRQPLSEEKIREKICKTGNTPFEFETLDIIMDPDIFLPVQELNNLRREALSQLENEIVKKFLRVLPREKENSYIAQTWNMYQNGSRPSITVSVETMEQLIRAVDFPEVSDIYVSYRLFYDSKANGLEKQLGKTAEMCRRKEKQVFFLMPPIFRRSSMEYYAELPDMLQRCGFDGAVVRTIDELGFLAQKEYKGKIRSDYSLYSMNAEAAKRILQLSERDTIPLELNYGELKRRGLTDSELIVYGYIPLMISAQCVEKNLGKCRRDNKSLVLKDRYQKLFCIQKDCRECVNLIYNSAPLWLAGCEEKIEALSPASIRLSFTREEAKETEDILRDYIQAFLYGKKVSYTPAEFTRGHFNRGVD